MTLSEFFKSKSKAELDEIAMNANTTYENLQQIFLYGGAVSTRLAIRIAANSGGELSAKALKPDLALLDSQVA